MAAAQVRNYLLQNSPTATFIMDFPQMPQKRSMLQQIHDDVRAKKVSKLEAEKKQPETLYMPTKEKILEAKIKKQDEVIANQKVMLEAKIKKQDNVIANQKAMLEAKIKKQDEVIGNQKAMLEEKIKKQDEVIAIQKAMLEAKIKKQDEVIANQKVMLEAANLQQEKLISQIIKCRMADLKVQIESGYPDLEVIRSVGIEIKSAMELIPGSLRVNMETLLCYEYKEMKSMFLARNDALWKKIENVVLGNIRHSDHSTLRASKPSSANLETLKAMFEEWETHLRKEMADREAALTAALEASQEAMRKDMEHKLAVIMHQKQRRQNPNGPPY